MTDFTETRSKLKKLAMEHGADTPIGHACHNLLELTENLAKTINDDDRLYIKMNIERQMKHLEKLRQSQH